MYGKVTIFDEGLMINRKISLSCHTFCDTGPRILQSISKDLSNLVAFYLYDETYYRFVVVMKFVFVTQL